MVFCVLRWLCVLIFGVVCWRPAVAEVDWWSVTLDNDLFVGDDSGYTNGLFISAYQLNEESPDQKPHWSNRPLAWSLSAEKPDFSIQSFTLGQIMLTPQDISVSQPEPDDFPYVGMLFLNSNHVRAYQHVADKISTVIGVTGPASLAGEAQKTLHKILGSTPPRGWDTQNDSELVFQFGRGRLWRQWTSASDRMDFLTLAELTLGTITSEITGGLMWRYGARLTQTFMAPLLSTMRTTNPVAIEGDWYAFAEASSSYTFNQVFNDGNSFRQDDAPDYDRSLLHASVGYAYSKRDWSLTFAISDVWPLSGDVDEALAHRGLKFGTFTIAWRD